MSEWPVVTLVPYTEDQLPAVRPWFTHPEVRRRLGGPDWPERELRQPEALGEIFRGRRVLRIHSWVALDESGAAVAHLGGEVYDRWCRYAEAPDGPVVSDVEAGPAMGLAYVVDPHRWRRGFGRAALLAAVGAPEVRDVILFALGIEPDNVASRRCAESAGFRPDDPEPDWEDIVHHLLRRPRR
ncbi:GNAT family N-acetyltransferase [Jidongwangia harbinensis]|uniref:GNAT family N-acetyltransferase n=1 Tax=Jidongwangia harbinensis TaxID=2878561 RepID=UPI001CD9415A|nr:GNAT family N-acetyltransferase [Jidongwangia harbinensis]MCA2219412.1 GNAT family N-acetyltransferase [Jidongwangia harbinensis]